MARRNRDMPPAKALHEEVARPPYMYHFPRHPQSRPCRAVQDGVSCAMRGSLPLCPLHLQEHRTLWNAYDLMVANFLCVRKEEVDSDSANDKMAVDLSVGQRLLTFRNDVMHRVGSIFEDNHDHVRQLLTLRSDVCALEKKVAVQDALKSKSSPSPVPRNGSETKPGIFSSLLHKETPMSALSHLPRNSPVVVMRQHSGYTLSSIVERLYTMAPALNDTSSVVRDRVTRVLRAPNVRDCIIRFVFREYILCTADADVLARACQTESMDDFLRQSMMTDLVKYVKFFQAFEQAGDAAFEQDSSRFLRDAVYDYLADPPLSPITILGGAVTISGSSRRMEVKGWDLLWEHFYGMVRWWNLEHFAFHLDDVVLVKALTACLRYGSGDLGEHGDPSWLSPHEDVSQESGLATIQGFIAIMKGFDDSSASSAESSKEEIFTERQTRNYLAGRISNRDRLAQQLGMELRYRVARFQVHVYYRGPDPPPDLGLPPLDVNENVWIVRSRSASTKEALALQPWTVEWSAWEVMTDVERVYGLRDGNFIADFYEMIIVDRTPGRSFDILDVVAGALCKLKGDLPYGQVFRQTVQKYVPVDEQGPYLEAFDEMEGDQSLAFSSSMHVWSRIRCWDVVDGLSGLLPAVRQKSLAMMTLPQSRIISQVSYDLEASGVVTQIMDYEQPRTCPVLTPAADGVYDLYFHYDLTLTDNLDFGGLPLNMDPPQKSLVEFAEAYQRTHPGAVFSKGNIKVHYCAWPLPMPPEPVYSSLNYSTPEGRMYRWKVLPFDAPLALSRWQTFVNQELNQKLPFAHMVETTLVICAVDCDGADASLQALLGVGAKHEWTFSVPPPASWTTDLASLHLGTLLEGIRPV